MFLVCDIKEDFLKDLCNNDRKSKKQTISEKQSPNNSPIGQGIASGYRWKSGRFAVNQDGCCLV